MGNGMKSGSGDDPFANMEADDNQADENDDVDESSEPAESESDADLSEPLTSETEPETTSGSSGLPWRYARESAKSERDMVHSSSRARHSA